ncbi:MAG: hypothetical protein PHH01_00030 [Patescibacteria group bacterium]|nr:hypothetical protein [Patescibacteria group bacterium]
MAEFDHLSYKPYQHRVFLMLLLSFLVFMLVADATVYYLLTNAAFRQTQKTLKDVATEVSAKVPVATLERLIDSSQQNSDEYREIESIFQSAMSGNPSIDDIYTLRQTATPNRMSFIVTGDTTRDSNGNNVIEEFEQKAMLGEIYDTTDFPELVAAMEKPSVDKTITYDKWGAWLSGYAPLRNASGQSVAILGVDYSAEIIQKQRNDTLQSLLIADLIFLPILLLASYFLSLRLSRPFRILAQGMDKLAQGDFKYHLPLKHRGEEKIFVELFNNITTMFSSRRIRDDKKNSPGEEADKTDLPMNEE